MFFMQQPQKDNTYSSHLELDLDTVEPCISGPKRLVLSIAVVLDMTTYQSVGLGLVCYRGSYFMHNYLLQIDLCACWELVMRELSFHWCELTYSHWGADHMTE